jgi:hypothetical protein
MRGGKTEEWVQVEVAPRDRVRKGRFQNMGLVNDVLHYRPVT